MDGSTPSVNIDKLSDQIYHISKQKTMLVIDLRDIHHCFEKHTRIKMSEKAGQKKFESKNHKGSVEIGLSISDENID